MIFEETYIAHIPERNVESGLIFVSLIILRMKNMIKTCVMFLRWKSIVKLQL